MSERELVSVPNAAAIAACKLCEERCTGACDDEDSDDPIGVRKAFAAWSRVQQQMSLEL